MRTNTLNRTVTERRAYSIPELGELYPVSTGFLRCEINRGALKIRRFGRRIIVLKEDWDAYVQKAGSGNKSQAGLRQ